MLTIFLLSSFLFLKCVGLQSFSPVPVYTEVKSGDTMVMNCFIQGKGGVCQWEKNGQPVGIFPGKYEWAGDLDHGNCSLRIIDAISEYDDGVWQCQVTASDFEQGDSLISDGAKVGVQASPRDISLQSSEVNGKITVVSGTETDIICSSEGGNPPPKLYITVNGKVVE